MEQTNANFAKVEYRAFAFFASFCCNFKQMPPEVDKSVSQDYHVPFDFEGKLTELLCAGVTLASDYSPARIQIDSFGEYLSGSL